MISVCLVVASIVGQWCATGVENILVGDCTEMGRDSYLCQVEYLPAFLSYYDPSICDAYPTNCLDGGTHFGNGEPVTEERYGDTAACPIDWVPQTVAIDGVGRWVCRDTGGGIAPVYREVWLWDNGTAQKVWMWVVTLDILYHHTPGSYPWWAFRVFDWSFD